MEAKSDGVAAPASTGRLSFLKGGEEFLTGKGGSGLPWDEAVEAASQQLSEAFGARHVAFLVGSGASSLAPAGKQVGIPTMAPLASEFGTTIGKRADKKYLTASERQALLRRFGIDLTADPYVKNIEKLMEVLFSVKNVLNNSSRVGDEASLKLVDRCITKVKAYVLGKCTEGTFQPLIGDEQVLDLYKTFYRKLVFRDRSLPRPWVFTTNYDLFNETAMDQLGLPYCNGFSGTIERRFNPSTYRYALAEQIDLTQRRWIAVDGFVYLCKLHGSVSWVEDHHGLYPIRELQEASTEGKVMIYPTPSKQNSSFGAPYSDLFREFQSRIAREQSVLFTLGYGFGDEHVNNIIYQSLTIPTFRLVIFGASSSNLEIQKLADLNDPRIWIITGETPEGAKAHHFETVVRKLLPTQPSDRVDAAVAKVIEQLIRPSSNTDRTENGRSA